MIKFNSRKEQFYITWKSF